MVKNESAIHTTYQIRAHQLVKAPQYRSLMQGEVIGLITLDFILRFIRAGMMNVTFVGDVASMHFHDFSMHPPGFRIPAHAIANLERLRHDSPPVRYH
jgi:hypothetical protein